MSLAQSEIPTAKPLRRYVPAVGPRLRWLLIAVLGLTALLGANSAYLLSVTVVEWFTGLTYQNYFYQYMFLGHLALGLLLVLPLVVFGFAHMFNTRHRKNKRAMRIGYALFAVSIAVLVSGVLLMRIGSFELKLPAARSTVYWLHVACPLVAAWMYWLHRLAGPKIRWRVGMGYIGLVGAAVLAMVLLHSQDPRRWNVAGPKEGVKYFEPSLARTSTGNFIPANTLMMNEYCLKCHQDVYDGWYHSVHRFSSFNNPAYLASVRETREVALKRDGNVQASRWCAGCHDPVPFFSGAFDDPKFDMVKHATAQAGITCTVCHAITHVNSTRGNADFTIEEPQHYPFAQSDNEWLQFINQQMVKAKPEFHKKTFLKPFHKTAEFCSTCHKVHLPYELNNYKEFLRGQNHYDTYLLSGVSGHGIRSFYYPPKSITNCAGCHMPLKASNDFGAKYFGGEKLSIHNHLFPAANTAIAWLRNEPEVVAEHQKFLQEITRVDLFGLREGGAIDGKLLAPLRPELLRLKPGQKYLLETVVRTLKIGHPLTQGTVDSNELWLDVLVKSGDRVIGSSGGIDSHGEVDPWSHFINVFMLDRNGNRIDRRNPQDIFVPLYNHQIPPGAAGVVHYDLVVPEDSTEPITIEVKLQYRKFDKQYVDFFTRAAKPGDPPIRDYEPGKPYGNPLPITTLASDQITLAIEGGPDAAAPQPRDIPIWQRWNDYGIGLLLEGQGGAKGELRQATDAFAEVEKLGRYDGPLNVARVFLAEGRIDEAVAALKRAGKLNDPSAPAWTLAWLSGLANRQQGHLEDAVHDFRSALDPNTPDMQERKLDFSLDYEVINELGLTLFEQAKQLRGKTRTAERESLLRDAAMQFEKTLAIDSENSMAHYNLQLVYHQLGDETKASEHASRHAAYKADDNARDRAMSLARQKYPAANFAAEALVIYPLDRPGAPRLAATSDTTSLVQTKANREQNGKTTE